MVDFHSSLVNDRNKNKHVRANEMQAASERKNKHKKETVGKVIMRYKRIFLCESGTFRIILEFYKL